MSGSGKVIKPVAFNAKNPKEEAMLKHVKRRNFSGYVKKLIGEDMERRGLAPITQQQPDSEEKRVREVSLQGVRGETPQKANVEAETAKERFERLKQQQKGGRRPPIYPVYPGLNDHINR